MEFLRTKQLNIPEEYQFPGMGNIITFKLVTKKEMTNFIQTCVKKGWMNANGEDNITYIQETAEAFLKLAIYEYPEGVTAEDLENMPYDFLMFLYKEAHNFNTPLARKNVQE